MEFFSGRVFAGKVEPLNNQISQTIKKNIKYLTETHTHTFLNGSAGIYKTRVQKFRVYLSKAVWTLDTE